MRAGSAKIIESWKCVFELLPITRIHSIGATAIAEYIERFFVNGGRKIALRFALAEGMEPEAVTAPLCL